MNTRHARQIRAGLHYGTNWSKQMFDVPTIHPFLMECLDEWSKRSSDLTNRAAARAIRRERIRRGGRP